MSENNIITLRDLIFDALQQSGYDLLSVCEYWNKFKAEVKELQPGKYTYMAGNTAITFTKA